MHVDINIQNPLEHLQKLLNCDNNVIDVTKACSRLLFCVMEAAGKVDCHINYFMTQQFGAQHRRSGAQLTKLVKLAISRTVLLV